MLPLCQQTFKRDLLIRILKQTNYSYAWKHERKESEVKKWRGTKLEQQKLLLTVSWKSAEASVGHKRLANKVPYCVIEEGFQKCTGFQRRKYPLPQASHWSLIRPVQKRCILAISEQCGGQLPADSGWERTSKIRAECRKSDSQRLNEQKNNNKT